MGPTMLGAMLALLSAQNDPPALARRIPFETGQLRHVTSLRDDRQCAATGLGRYEAHTMGLCWPDATPPSGGGLRTVVISFTRAGERAVTPGHPRGRRLYDLEADVSLTQAGAFGTCRLIREQGTPHIFFFGNGRGCEALLKDVPMFATTQSAAVRQGRLRISIFVDALPAEINQLLGPPPPMVVAPMTPPPVMMMPSPPAPPPPPPPMAAPAYSRPVPIDRHAWFRSDDYPAAALRAEERGTVFVRLQVGADGRVADCTITQSSGSASLDAATCRIFRLRARYQPARDARDRRVASTVMERVRWELPADELLLREPAYAALSIGIDLGIRSHCTDIGAIPEGNGLGRLGCVYVLPANQAVPAAIAQGHGTVRVTLEVARENAPRPNFTRERGRIIFATVASFAVQPDGSIGDCLAEAIVAPREASTPAFDLCAALRAAGAPLFSPRSGAAPEHSRVILTVFEGRRR